MTVIRPKDWALAPKDWPWDADEAVARIRVWAGGPDKAAIDWERYRSCHMWYDSDNPENYAAYKLPYCDIIDGRPHIVWRALVAIRAALHGARGGVDIPEADVEELDAIVSDLLDRFASQRSIERRAAPRGVEVRERDGQPVLAGYAAVFDQPSLPLGWGFVEVVRRGAFAKTLRDGADVRCYLNHDPSLLLGRRSAGTLRLEEDSLGLRFEVDVPDTSYGRDVLALVRRGDLSQCSFAFTPIRERWRREDGQDLRELVEVRLYDVSVVSEPAYPQTTVSVRALLAAAGHEEAWDLTETEAARRALELLSARRAQPHPQRQRPLSLARRRLQLLEVLQ